MTSTSLRRQVLTMGVGTAIAQVIPLAVGPLLTRLYDPHAYGVMASTVALALLLSVVATARYELAIVLPEADRVSRAIAGAALILATAVSIAAMILTVVAEVVCPRLAGSSRIGTWIVAVPLIAWLMACGQIGNCIANRGRDYPRMAGAAILQQAISAAVGCLLGLFAMPLNGLMVGRLAGHVAYAAAFSGRLRDLIVERGRSWDLRDCRAACSRYRQFPTYNLPYSLVGGFSRDFVVLALTYRHFVEAAGLYGVARMVVSAPVYFVSSTLTQVFFREASEKIGTPEFGSIVLRLVLRIATIGAPLLAWLAFWGLEVFAGVFGEAWRPAGAFASALCLPASLHLLTSWMTRTFEVCQQQKKSFRLQICSDMLSIVVVLALLMSGQSPFAAVWGFVVCQVGFHVLCLALIFDLLQLGRPILLRLLSAILALWGLAWSIGFCVATVLDGYGAASVHLLFCAGVSFAMFLGGPTVARLLGGTRY